MNDEKTPRFHVGQLVAVREGYSTKVYHLHIVKSVGEKTGQVTLDTGERFLASGWPIGRLTDGKYRLVVATPEIEREAIRQAYVRYLSAVRWETMTDNTLLDVLRALRFNDVRGVPDHTGKIE